MIDLCTIGIWVDRLDCTLSVFAIKIYANIFILLVKGKLRINDKTISNCWFKLRAKFQHLLAPANNIDDKDDQASHNNEKDDPRHNINRYQSAWCCCRLKFQRHNIRENVKNNTNCTLYKYEYLPIFWVRWADASREQKVIIKSNITKQNFKKVFILKHCYLIIK